MTRKADKELSIAVSAGQHYWGARRGAPRRRVRVLRVLRRAGQPAAKVREVTRAGTPKRGALEFEARLTPRDGAWRMRPGYELVSD